LSILGAIFGKKGWAGQSAGVPRIAIFEIRILFFGALIVLCAFGTWSWMQKLDRQSYVSVPSKVSKVEVGEEKEK
jgi:type VI protein secretion system component VasK